MSRSKGVDGEVNRRTSSSLQKLIFSPAMPTFCAFVEDRRRLIRTVVHENISWKVDVCLPLPPSPFIWIITSMTPSFHPVIYHHSIISTTMPSPSSPPPCHLHHHVMYNISTIDTGILENRDTGIMYIEQRHRHTHHVEQRRYTDIM